MFCFILEILLAGAIFSLFTHTGKSKFFEWAPFIVSCVTSILGFYTLFSIKPDANGLFVLGELKNYGTFLSSKFYLDSASLLMVGLVFVIFPICFLFLADSFDDKFKNFRAQAGLFLFLEMVLLIFFSTNNALLFFISFEFSLIPMIFVIGIWGAKERVYAAMKFFLYTFAGSLCFLATIAYIFSLTNSFDLEIWKSVLPTVAPKIQNWLWIGFFFAFAVKIPMVPFHTWLPDAHVQAPTAGSVILAGILIKMGAYGFLKFSIPLLPIASAYFAPYMIILGVIAIIYASMIAFSQKNVKKMIAYSSVAHMGFVVAGAFSGDSYGIQGAVFQMFSHGLISAALFLCVGIVYRSTHTLDLVSYGGLVKRSPFFAYVFLFFAFASMGLPGTSGFIGEFLSSLGVFFSSGLLLGILALSGMIFGATYMLKICRFFVWGSETQVALGFSGAKLRENVSLLVLVSLVFFSGIAPAHILHGINANSLKGIIKIGVQK